MDTLGARTVGRTGKISLEIRPLGATRRTLGRQGSNYRWSLAIRDDNLKSRHQIATTGKTVKSENILLGTLIFFGDALECITLFDRVFKTGYRQDD